ncbi:hypothetical protein QMA10_16080 [Arthrobacter sp. APC 3897]|mgnify:CR=1 FL=1|uniref:hypothetical protein n=1 Tax=Arthrobacter sp. APC 3897 TaxID=3035204 RepID=UPI0025B573F9|nr:hypothetical protein [Arthrobacter sp. APC 3897]MDN3483433.1 hypothetical protein [Arthrobacter sp. APC 3897]
MLTQLSSAVLAASETAEHHVSIPMDPIMYGVIIMGAFLVLMFATISFQSVGHRHEATAEHVDPQRQFPNKHDHGQGIEG